MNASQEPWEEAGFAERVVTLAADWTDHLAATDRELSSVMRPWIRSSRQSLGTIHIDPMEAFEDEPSRCS
jgi:hypothetical protein